MRKRASPCIMVVYKHGSLGTCHCGKETDIVADLWFDRVFVEELQAKGTNQEYASRLAMEKSVKHQRKVDSTPFQVVHNCLLHVASSIDLIMGQKGIGQAQVLSWALVPSGTLILFDRNETVDDTYPSIVTYWSDDIRSFLDDYQHHPEKFISFSSEGK